MTLPKSPSPTSQLAGSQYGSFSFAMPGASSTPDIFGLWSAVQSNQQAFSANLSDDVGMLWRADLPGDSLLSETILGARKQQLIQVQSSLPQLERRLGSDLANLSGQPMPAAGVSFSLGSDGAFSPRSYLTMALQHQSADVSFGILDQFKIDTTQFTEAAHAVANFSEQVRRNVEQFALVETTSAGKRLGLTRAAWSGDIETWWAAGIDPSFRMQHEQVLAQALATRQGWLRFLLTLAGGITRVAATLAAGPFSLISIWTTWNYLTEVVTEYRRAAAVSSSSEQGNL